MRRCGRVPDTSDLGTALALAAAALLLALGLVGARAEAPDARAVGAAAPPAALSADAEADAAADATAEAPAVTLECHMRKYTYKVVKTDGAGHQCWDYVGVMSCWGRCDSHEISDWRFPYKLAYHPVCLHGARQLNAVTLRNCEPAAEPGTERYEFLEALSCRCSVCKSSEASCEGLRFRAPRAPAASAAATVTALGPAGLGSARARRIR